MLCNVHVETKILSFKKNEGGGERGHFVKTTVSDSRDLKMGHFLPKTENRKSTRLERRLDSRAVTIG